MGGTWAYLDLTALGRQEQWEDSPEGYPQTPAYTWWNWHDEYDEAAADKGWSDQVQRGVTAFRDVYMPAKLGPDFFTMAAENHDKVKDFYFPNDTHISTYGQEIMGKMMLQTVREALAKPAAAPQ